MVARRPAIVRSRDRCPRTWTRFSMNASWLCGYECSVAPWACSCSLYRGHHDLVRMLVPVRIVMVVVTVLVPLAGKTPDQQAEARQHQDGADDVSLLDVDLLLEAGAYRSHHAGQDQRRENVAAGGETADPGHPQEAPPLSAGNNRQRHPVVGEVRVDEADPGGRANEQDQRSHALRADPRGGACAAR
jgi:hypothetical protein